MKYWHTPFAIYDKIINCYYTNKNKFFKNITYRIVQNIKINFMQEKFSIEQLSLIYIEVHFLI